MTGTFFLINGLEGGGAERVCISLANFFHARGEKISLFVGSLGGRKYDDSLNPEIPLFGLGSISARKCWWRLLGLLKKEGARTVVVFSFQWALMLILLRIAFGLKIKIIVRNISSITSKKKIHKSLWSRFNYFLVDQLYNRADFFIAQCEGMKGELVRDFRISSDRVSVIYNPVSPFIEAEVEIGSGKETRPSSEAYFLYVGSFKVAKNIEDCLRAYSIVASLHPDVQLRICGEGSLEPVLLGEIERLGIAGRARLEGFRNDLRPLYANALATLLTSHYEGFPNVLVESISMGTPVISYDCPHGPREIVVEGVNGYLVAPGDCQGFAEKMGEILRNPPDRDGVRQTSRRFSIENIGPQYIRLIKALSEG